MLDHIPPPLTRADLHRDLAALETLIDEYSSAADLDPPRAKHLAENILASARAMRLDEDLGVARDAPVHECLRALDAHLCDLKEMQIRDGLHIFADRPIRGRRDTTIVAIARVPRSDARPADASLHRALAADLALAPSIR